MAYWLAQASAIAPARTYAVSIVDHGPTPAIAANDTCLNFNPSFITASPTFNQSGVMLRQCCGPTCAGHGDQANLVSPRPERIGFAPCDLESGKCGSPDPDFNLDPQHDTEDPRAFYYDGFYYMFYYSGGEGAAGPGASDCTGPLCTVRLAKTQTPLVAASWKVLQTLPWHRNGCCAMAPRGQKSYCIWGEGPDPSPGLGIWSTTDIDSGIWSNETWSVAPGVRSPLTSDGLYLLPLGANQSEIKLEAGTHLMRLSSGDWLHLYAAATPGWVAHGNYTVGYVILDGDDPSRIVQRSQEHVLVPTFDYETLCNGAAGCKYRGERKNVIFMCSATPLAAADTFRLFFGGGDGNVGTAVVRVQR